jgi:glycosyltransferase involved in cell wall biosynthesis
MKKQIDIVIPIYNEEKNIGNLFARLEKVTGAVPDIGWRYIFVNDGSPDGSMNVLRELAKNHPQVMVVDFSRNFGKEVALSAGVQASAGDAVICMDADLQHPPELIPDLIREWRLGAEVVATVRTHIDKQPLLRRLGSHGYYWLMSKVSGLDMVSQTTDFRLIDKKVIEAFRTMTERQRMFRGIIDWMGFRKVYVEFQAAAREEGSPGYSYRKLWQLAINSLTSFSLFPLRMTGYLGFIITFLSGILLVFMLINYALGTRVIFTPIAMVVVANTLLIGIVLMAIGLVALYIGTIHTEVINRPLYIVRETLNNHISSGGKSAIANDLNGNSNTELRP